MSKKIKYDIVEAQSISMELKTALGRYTKETEELLSVLRDSSLCEKDQDVIEKKGSIEKNNQRLLEYETFVNENIAKTSSVIEELFMSVEVLYAQQISEFRNPNSKGYKELMGNVKAIAYQELSQVSGLGDILKSSKVVGTAKDIRDTLLGTLVDNTYMKLINDTVEYQGDNRNITKLYGKKASNLSGVNTKIPPNPTKCISAAYLISDTIKSFNSYGNSKDPSRLAGDLTGIAVKKGADIAVGKITTTALASWGVGGLKGIAIGTTVSVIADLLMDPAVEYIKKHKVEEKRMDWEVKGIHKGWKKIQDLKLKYTIENYKAS
ncbi:hypothetical protein IA826_06195 [Listeria seeligeri]|uniref:hypothetical protein n=1 Tax=Listeria seeligeri TaxID=1640 RepID=UPI0016250832|nr:hypothetical protein [Listeria seeligeri]MBC2071364.1 hypothetical protein [Listeria seeligeri]MBC2087285.1 hypothetical protein [Listeria seeligeri]MBC2246855.1 hypothetical protein [Listeria seeligeri]MBF2401308.1 hypothetical protein [Listeria seeligeri]MBF2653075.1 hypothetical protein [Listeria seeligeri]